MRDLYIAVVCSSNMNRSMEAHAYLAKKGFKVKSYGTGEKVKLPGSSANRPIIYEFGISYDFIYNELFVKNKPYYTSTGILNMLDRNRRLKHCPEKFQMSAEKFDIIITCEERVYDQVLEWFSLKQSVTNKPVHIINIDIQDTHDEATIGAFVIYDMVTVMAQSEDLDNEIDEILHQFEAKCHRQILNCVMFY